MGFQSRVELDIEAPRDAVWEKLVDPRNNSRWMDDVKESDPIDGAFGMPGSSYRLHHHRASLTFVVHVLGREPPSKLRLRLEQQYVTVMIVITLEDLSDARTRLVSEETYAFDSGLLGRFMGWMGESGIRRSHGNAMEAFKAFAEGKAPDEFDEAEDA